MKPDGVAIPNCTVAWSMSPQVQPKVSHPHSSNQRLTAHTHMSEGERPQERTQRGGRVGPVEDPTQRPVPQQCHVVDAVGAGDHAGDQGGHLPTGVGALVRRNTQMPIRQHRQPGQRRQPHRRNQARRRHQIPVIEHRRLHRTRVRELHLRDALPLRRNRSLDKPNSVATQGHSHVTTRRKLRPSVDRGLVRHVRSRLLAPVRLKELA